MSKSNNTLHIAFFLALFMHVLISIVLFYLQRTGLTKEVSIKSSPPLQLSITKKEIPISSPKEVEPTSVANKKPRVEKEINNTKSHDVGDSTIKQAPPAISLERSSIRKWIESETNAYINQHPESLEQFNKSFSSDFESTNKPDTYATELKGGLIDVKTTLFGKNVCYAFDAGDDAFGVVSFYNCKEDSIQINID